MNCQDEHQVALEQAKQSPHFLEKNGMEANDAAAGYPGNENASDEDDDDSVLNSSKFGGGSGPKDELSCGQQNLNEANLE